MSQVTRYHPILVILHWLLAFFMIMALAMSDCGMSQTPNSAPDKI